MVILFEDADGVEQTRGQTNPTRVNFPLQLELPDIPPGEVVVLTPSTSGPADGSGIILTQGDRDTYLYRDSG